MQPTARRQKAWRGCRPTALQRRKESTRTDPPTRGRRRSARRRRCGVARIPLSHRRLRPRQSTLWHRQAPLRIDDVGGTRPHPNRHLYRGRGRSLVDDRRRIRWHGVVPDHREGACVPPREPANPASCRPPTNSATCRHPQAARWRRVRASEWCRVRGLTTGRAASVRPRWARFANRARQHHARRIRGPSGLVCRS